MRRRERRADRPLVVALESTERLQMSDGCALARMVDFPRSPYVEPSTDTVGGDALQELLEVLAEIGLEAAAERDRRKGELRVVAS